MATKAYSVNPTADVNVPTTTETVVATLSGVTLPRSGMVVQLSGWVELTAGTATTAVTPRIRRGVDATGTLVGEANPLAGGVVAGSATPWDVAGNDTPGDLANGTYVLTVQQTAATGAGTALTSFLQAIISD